ncbi:Ferric-pseudobactin 358 receptor [Halioglobus japonicus]|nr:Ferric-pseudobactin 358 receptor [Halioglobus japonicus]
MPGNEFFWKFSASAVIGIAALVITATPVSASQLEEVVVTAQKRVESLQDVPISVSAISGEMIRNNGMQNMEDLAVMIPNLNVSDSPGVNSIVIRGLGSGAGTISFEQSVGLYIDGIYAARAAMFQAPFLDLERVEVLRGPQGVLFGKNSIAGAVSVITAKPTDEFEAEISGTYEFEYDGNELTGLVSGPLTDNLFVRLVAKTAESGAYVDNKTTRETYPRNDAQVLRGTLVWEATDSTRVMFKAESSDYKEKGTSFQISDRDYAAPLPPFPGDALAASLLAGMEAGGEDFTLNDHSYQNDINRLRQDASNYTWEVSQAIGEFDLTYLGSYSEYTRKGFSDMDNSVVDFLKWDTHEEFEQYTQELRVTSPLGERFDYVAGLFYVDRTLKLPENPLDVNAPVIRSTGSIDYKEDASSWSAFAQGTWNFTESIRAISGLRYSSESKKAKASQVIYQYETDQPLTDPFALAILQQEFDSSNYSNKGNRGESNLDPTFTLQWDVTDSAMVYFTWARASKSGGYNSSDRSGDNFEYGDETAENFEFGLKSDLLDGAARINLAVFHTQYDDLQVSSFNGTSFEVGNAGKATSQGVELDALYALSDQWMLGTNLAYLDATYDEFDSSCPADTNQWRGSCVANNGAFQDMSGESLEFAPQWSGTLFVEYNVPVGDVLHFSARTEAVYQDEFSVLPTLDTYLVQGDFWKYNMRVAVESSDERWLVAIAGMNLSDKHTMNFGGPTLAVPGVYYGNYEYPRRIELSASYRFGK